jgi:hypothetical protein
MAIFFAIGIWIAIAQKVNDENLTNFLAWIIATATVVALVLSQEMQKRQQFENNFFNMLTIHNNIVSALEIHIERHKTSLVDTPARTIRGRQVFEYLYDQNMHNKNIHSTTGSTTIEVFNLNDYAKIGHIDILDHYFRHIFVTIKYIDGSSLSNKEKYEYLKILRASFSACEFCFLFYNGLHMAKIPNIGSEFKELIEKYALLHNLRIRYIPNQNAISIYKHSAICSKLAKKNLGIKISNLSNLEICPSCKYYFNSQCSLN